MATFHDPFLPMDRLERPLSRTSAMLALQQKKCRSRFAVCMYTRHRRYGLLTIIIIIITDGTDCSLLQRDLELRICDRVKASQRQLRLLPSTKACNDGQCKSASCGKQGDA
mmetsp:Transcript_107577/g.190307  ORF Transcript_107577/g.190307 Transcript_107577/m.190307 type:complete len:111 (+) Transcript_107577:96-428(+)